jgi:ubiquinol-cytochrome c reductase cytochrome c1 subunit
VISKLILAVMFSFPIALSAAEEPKLNTAPIDVQDAVSLQRGAKYFVNYCLSCHAASNMSYMRLQDLGLSEQQIKDYLLFTGDKVSTQMQVAMAPKDAREWFGVPPPDLSVIARSRSPDWLFTYLRGFYRDDSSPSGWNNVVFQNVAMPHVLYELQGVQRINKDERGNARLVIEKPGQLTQVQYDQLVADLVSYLVWMAEPVKGARIRTGIVVVFFLAALAILVYFLKREYWKDVH